MPRGGPSEPVRDQWKDLFASLKPAAGFFVRQQLVDADEDAESRHRSHRDREVAIGCLVHAIRGGDVRVGPVIRGP